MLYSLSRYRYSKPQPPFQLGGQYERAGDRHFLKNAVAQVELRDGQGLLRSAHPGDLLVVDVDRVEGAQLHIQKVRVEVARKGRFEDRPKPHVERFALFLNFVRQYFLNRGFSEVLTPTLVMCPGLEPALEPFSTELSYGRQRETVYLPTSPEIHLKKAMPFGWTDSFEIKNCFRKGEFSQHHEAEFTMLEWYRGFADLELIARDLEDLLATLVSHGWIEGAAPQVRTTDFAALFLEVFDFELRPTTRAEDLRGLCKALNLHFTDDDSFNDLFHRLLIDKIEPRLAALGPVVVRRFPPSQAALARRDAQGWADRFEFYWRGLEIANAFNEVCDPQEQKQRWADEIAERKRLGSSPVPEDPGLIEALAQGVPPCGGIAMGLERLYMACANIQEIRALKLFSSRDLVVR